MVQLGHAVGEPVDAERIDVHRTLGAKIAGKATAEVTHRRETQYLSFWELSTDPGKIHDGLRLAADVPSEAVITIDLALTPYDLLGERPLFHLAKAAVAMVEHSDRALLLLLPQRLPPNTSLLWLQLQRADTEGRVVAASTGGDIRCFGTPLPESAVSLKQAIRRDAERLSESLQDRFERKIVRRLGHFKATDRKRRPRCARFHYDCDLAAPELTDLIERWLRRKLRPKQGLEGATLVLCGVESGWMINAAMIVAGRVGARCAQLPARPKSADIRALPKDRRNVLVFDVVSSGATLDAAVKAMSNAGAPFESFAYAALASGEHVLSSGPVTVEPAAIRPREMTTRDNCLQHAATVPYTSPAKPERWLQISSFDMWAMLSDVDWRAEAYGPAGHERFAWLPDFSKVFDNYGNWIALRYAKLLEHLRHTSDVVVVCPDEPAVQALVAKLRLRFEDRLVAVAVSRRLINEIAAKEVKVADVKRNAEENPAQDWQLQLLQLRERQVPVIVLDEFAASGGTAAAMIELLRSFKVEVAAYLPFLDFNTRLTLRGGVAVHPLYTLPNPRPKTR
ncbi:MAG: hypothetical protein V7607_2618 [Solirubrobacteraceae bacterium]